MTTNRWGVIYCPKEGSSKTHKRWGKIRHYMQEQGIQFDFVQSEGAGSVERLANMMTTNGYRTIIVVGGDAALNDALNGILEATPAGTPHPVLGVIPNGFGNDFARFWGLDADSYRHTIDSFAHRRTRRVDVGRIHLYSYEQDGGKKETTRYFLNCVNVGLAASIIKLKRKAHSFWGIPPLSYLTSAFLLLFERKTFGMKFSINQENFEQRNTTLCIGSSRGYGLTPSAVPYNGLLDVSAVRQPPLTKMVSGLYLLFTGRFLSHKGINVWRSQRVEIKSTGRACVSIDGHALHYPVKALTADIIAEEIEFLIP